MARTDQTQPPRRKQIILYAFGFVLVLVIVIAAVRSSRTRTKDEHEHENRSAITMNDFAGSQSCAACHQKQYDLWKMSTHGLAGGEPDKARIIAKFDGKPLRFKDGTVTPTKNAKGDYIFVIEPEGGTKQEIKIDAVVGGGHLFGGGTQSFFQKFADGTVRFLPFDFIRREDTWFVQLRRDKTWAPISREISLQTDLANWPPHRVLGTLTEFSNCQNCHGSQIAARYDTQNHKYDTRHESLTINCESCHGPGKRHIEIVSKRGRSPLTPALSPNVGEGEDIGMKPLATLSKDESLNVCFQCHASKDAIREEAYLPGMRLEDYFSLKLPVFADAFTVDGRVRGFGYQSTHLYSACYLNGSMTCVDCHDPHSQNYRDVFGKSLPTRFDNGQCTACHASKAINPTAHSHHPTNTTGNLCVGCHMPYLQHQSVGTNFIFTRSDHSIPIPRPHFDGRLGIENACQKCHRDQDESWQETKMKQWYGEIKPHHPMIANLLDALLATNQASAAKFLLDPEARHPMAQMAGLLKFTAAWLRPNVDPTKDAPSPQPSPQMGEREIVAKLKTFAQSDDLDLKAIALMALHLAYNGQSDVQALLAERLKSSEEAVKDRWAVAMDYFGGTYAENDLPSAIIAFKKSLEVRPENVVTISHLAMALLRLGDSAGAIAALKTGLKARPEKAVLHFQLAQTFAQLQQVPEAIKEMEEGLKYSPEDPTAKSMLQQLRGP